MIGKKSIILSVSQLNNQAKHILERKFSDVNVRGEISSLKHYPSGYTYFSIKDEKSEISCVALPNTPKIEKLKIGLEFDFNAMVSIYLPKGKFQLLINSFEKNQSGALWEKYIALKEQLQKEGLFEAIYKKKIPTYPFNIGIISSMEGAVIHDMKKIFSRKSPHINLYLKSSKVQGRNSVNEIIEGINYFNDNYDFLDAIIIARGGGSFEDLNCFNDKSLCRKIFNSRIPIITAIGHETDFTISDFVSDLSASTPSVAAEILSDSSKNLLNELYNDTAFIQNSINSKLLFLNNETNHLKSRLSVDYITEIINRLYDQKENLDRILSVNVQDKISSLYQKVSGYKKSLDSNNIKNILQKGFGLIKNKDNKVISKAKRLNIGQKISIYFIDGKIEAEIIEK